MMNTALATKNHNKIQLEMAHIFRTTKELRDLIRPLKKQGKIIGVVPTMGALHDGHLSLVKAAQQKCDHVIATIFVNPTQFNNPDDLAKYPRTEEKDVKMLQKLGVSAIFSPSADDVYPNGFSTTVSVKGVSEPLEGTMRQGHFEGVATIVTKLLNMTLADYGFFGEKDWQQLQVIRRLATDLNLPVEICGCPTLRELDGLAMSSRNALLSKEHREIAPLLHENMQNIAIDVQSGKTEQAAIETAKHALINAGFEKIEYIELRDAQSLELPKQTAGSNRLLAAVWLGGVRLIDNIAV